MRRVRHLFPLRALLLALALTGACRAADSLRLTLPPVVYATPDAVMSLYHDNMVLTEIAEDYAFEFTCDVGHSEAQRWTVKPTDSDVGDHPLQVTVKDATGKVLQQGKTVLHVSPRVSTSTKPLRLLIVGDSLTNANAYPKEIYRLLNLPGNPKTTLLGTNRPDPAQPGVGHEGYGGWTWSNFLTRYTPATMPDPNGRKGTSPFVFPSADGKTGEFDLDRYFREQCDNQPPDMVFFFLGINDCFGADPKNPDPRVNEVLDSADMLLAAFHKSAPKAILAVGLTPPANARQSAFTNNYKDAYPRWGWKRIQHRLVERMFDRLSNREDEGIVLVPTELNIDPVDGYPEDNSVHPNAAGYAQIADSFYSWLKSKY